MGRSHNLKPAFQPDGHPSGGKVALSSLVVVLGWMLAASGPLAAQVNISPLWQVSPDAGTDFIHSTGNTERGAAISPVNGHVYVVTRAWQGVANTLDVTILDGTTGEETGGYLDVSFTPRGTFPLSTIGIADDGVIYAANLVTSANTGSGAFIIYRWADEGAGWTEAYNGSPSDGMRFGDSLDVRGSGAGTQILAGAGGTATAVRFVVFTTSDGQSFEAHAFSPSGVTADAFQLGVSFGEGSTMYGTRAGRDLLHAQFNLADGTSQELAKIGVPASISPISYSPELKLLAGMDYFGHRTLVYNIANPATPILLFEQPSPTANVNGNGVGAVDFGPERLISLDTNNGIVALEVTESVTPEPPSILSHPASVTTLQGGRVTFTVGATGTEPFTYEWFLGEDAIPGVNSPVLIIESAQPDDAGTYTVKITNSEGEITSDPATLTVDPVVQTGRLSLLWSLSPGDRPYITSDNTQRGLAYNPASGNVALVSRVMSDRDIYVLDGDTGADLHRLRNTDASGANLITGGTYALNMIGAADDGALYACNLTTSGTSAGLKIYRWANDSPDTVPTVAYQDPDGGAPVGIGRLGDTIDVRGAGTSTQILLSARDQNQVAIFTTQNGTVFTPTVVTVDANPGDFGLGIAFGEGDTFWGKSSGGEPPRPLRHVSFDLAAGSGTTIDRFDPAAGQFPAIIFNIGVHVERQLLAGIASQTPDNLQLYDISALPDPPVLVHQELFRTDNPNTNGTGAIDFAADRLYALGTNNGIAAYEIKEGVVEPVTLSIRQEGGLVILEWEGDFVLQAGGTPSGTWADIGTVSPHADDPSGSVARFYRLRRPLP